MKTKLFIFICLFIINKTNSQNKYIGEINFFKERIVSFQSNSKDFDLLTKDINSGNTEMHKIAVGLSRLVISKSKADYYLGLNLQVENGGITKSLTNKSYIIKSTKIGILLKQIIHVNDLFFISTTLNPQVYNNTYIKKTSADTLNGKVIPSVRKMEEIDNAKFGLNAEIGLGIKILPKNRKQQVWIMPVYNVNLFSPFKQNQVMLKNRNIGIGIYVNF